MPTTDGLRTTGLARTSHRATPARAVRAGAPGSPPLVIDLRAAEDAGAGDPEHARIVAASWVVLARSGWDGLKVDLVLHEAGLSTRSFYRHFKSKSALMAELMEHEAGRADHILRAQVAEVADPRDQLVRWLHTFVGFGTHRHSEGRTRLFASTWAALEREFPDAVARARDRLLTSLVDVLDVGLRAGRFPAAAPERDAEHIFSLASGRLLHVQSNPGLELDDEVRGTCRFALRAVGCDPDD